MGEVEGNVDKGAADAAGGERLLNGVSVKSRVDGSTGRLVGG